MTAMSECVDVLPNLPGFEGQVPRAIAGARERPVYLADSGIAFERVRCDEAVTRRGMPTGERR